MAEEPSGPSRTLTAPAPRAEGVTRTLFWGTPEFALPSLRTLLDGGAGDCEVVGVVTRPPRPRGRGCKTSRSPVAAYAASRNALVLEPENPNAPQFVGTLRGIAPDVSVVVAYGRILSAEALGAARLGSFNLHASLLPALRGAAPVAWAVARGHPETGATVMRMVRQMDAGPILAQERMRIHETDTGSTLARRIADRGARLLAETIARVAGGGGEETEQDHAAATFAPKLTRESARIDWRGSARDVTNLARAMDAAPGAWTALRGTPLKLFAPAVVDGQGEPGVVLAADSREGLVVAAGDGAVRFGELQPPGKRRMPATAWTSGRGIAPGDCLE